VCRLSKNYILSIVVVSAQSRIAHAIFAVEAWSRPPRRDEATSNAMEKLETALNFESPNSKLKSETIQESTLDEKRFLHLPVS
jgi:hypothetical protein